MSLHILPHGARNDTISAAYGDSPANHKLQNMRFEMCDPHRDKELDYSLASYLGEDCYFKANHT